MRNSHLPFLLYGRLSLDSAGAVAACQLLYATNKIAEEVFTLLKDEFESIKQKVEGILNKG